VTPGDGVRVTTVVDVDPKTAFEVFTGEIGTWWRRDPRYRFDPTRPGTMRFEGGAGGRLIEAYDESGQDAFEAGRVLAWEPGARLVFEFRGRSFGPGETTEVEVRFEASGSGTRVTVEQRGWSRLPAGHPARHGHQGQAFTDMMGLWWADLLTRLRAHSRR